MAGEPQDGGGGVPLLCAVFMCAFEMDLFAVCFCSRVSVDFPGIPCPSAGKPQLMQPTFPYLCLCLCEHYLFVNKIYVNDWNHVSCLVSKADMHALVNLRVEEILV